MKEKMKSVILKILFFVPFILGTIGYVISGEKISDSFYGSFALYGASPVLDSYNLWIDLARWTAPLATASAVLRIIESVWLDINWWFYRFAQDSVAVYADSDEKIVFGKKIKFFYPGRKIKPFAKTHIIMLNSDMESLKFYEEHSEKLKGKEVYIRLQEIDYGLVKEDDKKNEVIFFDVNSAISRMLWKKICSCSEILKKENPVESVVIYGSGCLAESILNSGLLLNLYGAGQKITYHMIGNETFRIKHPDMRLMNQDRIVFHAENEDGSWEIIRKADIVIIADVVSARTLQMIAVNALDADVYIYSRHSGNIDHYMQLKNLKPFGYDTEIYTDENIRQESLIWDAKELNHEYARAYKRNECSDKDTEWKKLDGFLKWSNISASDYNSVLAQIMQERPDVDNEMLAELEHIRWCRFHYLNYWTWGIPETGGSRDKEKRIHKCLCPYSELAKEDKDKDRAVIERLRKRQSAEI